MKKSLSSLPTATAAAAASLLILALLLLLARDPFDNLRSPAPDPLAAVRGSPKKSLWSEKLQVEWKACPWWTAHAVSALPEKSNGYIKVECAGGLNQMRRDLCDGVGIARLLNATLLLPHFDVAAYWNDTSDFADIFDVDYFIRQMEGFLLVVKKLPEDLASKQPFLVDCPKRKTPFDYVEEVLPALLEHQVLSIRPAASQRLDRYPLYAKVARCQACYHAIRLVKHLEQKASHILDKIPHPFLALHLRFEPDMIAYSRCEYKNLSKQSVKAIKAARDSREPLTGDSALAWRRRGKCPLTPIETAFILHALNIPTDTPIYLATGDGLLERESFSLLYTNVYTKSKLLDKETLSQMRGNSKAALDYYISVFSDAYIATYFGNMDKMVVAMRALMRNWNTLVLNRRVFAEAQLKGLNNVDLAQRLWQSHWEAFIMGRGMALPDCFCEYNISGKS